MFVAVWVVLGGIFAFAVLCMIVRPRRPRLVAGSNPYVTNVGRDGFWIGPHTLSAGSPIRYRFMDQGRYVERTYIV